MLRHPVVHEGTRRKGIKSPGRDRKVFSNTADRTHMVNTRKTVMRGGIRL